ncbi:nitrogen fixation protein NifM [Oceanobacter mangrovi]|uniref:nitrogen fixation protein NifM n=1 Tax=Oceanobacter mangrovi TaxID=2862510 RepID=UPI001C8DCAD7|nr:nitrogen fixation protein NifM [Oceanobacter mangrovi]
MNTVAQQSSPAVSGYRFLRIASEKFGSAPEALSAQQQQEVARIAAHEQQIEAVVLGSQESRQVVIPASQVELAMQQIRDRYESDEAYEDALAAMGMEPDDLRYELERSLRVDGVLELVASKAVTVGETDAKLYYYMHQDRFARPERRIARHILLTVNPDFENGDEATVRSRATEISERLQRKPERFGEQALKHSECPTSLNDGILGNIPRGVLYAELESCLFAMQAGEISAPVRTELGWHVLYCESIEAADIIPLHEALPALTEKLQQQQSRRAQRQWVAERLQQTQSRTRQENH